MRNLRYLLEYVFLFVVFAIFRLLPAQRASACGGFIGRTIGSALAASRKARRNVELVFPDISPEEKDKVVMGMWDNLGRIIAEYPHLESLGRNGTVIEGAEKLQKALEERKGAICFGAHLGNWEINSAACLTQLGLAVDISYRAPNNPRADRLLMRARSLGGRIRAYPKSRGGGRNMMEAVKSGHILGILIDQKYREGIAVPFFGREAMTNPFFVQLAQKYGCPLIPIRNIRLRSARFKLVIYDPLKVFDDNGRPRPVEDVIAEAHRILEGWIGETPEQWLWLHRRWKDENPCASNIMIIS